MNLLERMSQEHLDMLKAEEEKFPVNIKNLKKELTNNTHFFDLTYQNILKLYMHLDLKDYTITSIEKLFKNVSS